MLLWQPLISLIGHTLLLSSGVSVKRDLYTFMFVCLLLSPYTSSSACCFHFYYLNSAGSLFVCNSCIVPFLCCVVLLSRSSLTAAVTALFLLFSLANDPYRQAIHCGFYHQSFSSTSFYSLPLSLFLCGSMTVWDLLVLWWKHMCFMTETSTVRAQEAIYVSLRGEISHGHTANTNTRRDAGGEMRKWWSDELDLSLVWR